MSFAVIGNGFVGKATQILAENNPNIKIEFDIKQIDKHMFHILCPFISDRSIELLNDMNNFNKFFYYSHIMKSFSNVYKDDEDPTKFFFNIYDLFNIHMHVLKVY